MRKRKYVALSVVVAAMLAMSGVAIATHGFTDVPDDHVFHDDIQWLKDTGITVGCNPPANDEFCPEDSVTRGQIAAFMHRLSNHVEDMVGEGVEGPQGPAGPAGPQGPAGEKGDQGDPGEDGYVGNILHNSFGADVEEGHFQVAATCAGTDDMVLGERDEPPGHVGGDPQYPIGGDAPNGPATDYVAISGGYTVGTGSGSTDDVNISMSRNELTHTPARAWLIGGHNNTGDTVNVRAWVTCIYAPDDVLTD